MADIRIGVAGAAGRMGRMLVAEAHALPGCVVAAGSEAPGNSAIGKDVGELAGVGALGVALTGDAAALFAAADVVLDFTSPGATVRHAELAGQTRKALVAGTTGLKPDQEQTIAEAAKAAAIVRAANFSLGVNLLLALVERAAAVLGPDAYDIEIVEMHHRHKVDAPSGTALALGGAAAKGRGVQLADTAVRGRDGVTGARKSGTIGFAALRGGDVAGDHMVVFAADGERIELGHRASSRQVFVRGAVAAARWVAGRKPGLYTMKDVLGL
jgi:4-hydroxy-tetrahydrodipicolinate reductase